MRFSYPDGDYENPELKNLNKRILWDSGYKHPRVMTRKKVNIEAIKQLKSQTNSEIYKDFIIKCNENKPWLWKDPRLCFTIHHWDYFLNKDEIQFIKITRDPYLVFRSHSKRHIRDSLKNIVQTYHEENVSVDNYLSDNQIPFLNIDYSELNDISIIYKINSFLGIDIKESEYSFIKKDNKKKKESEYKFALRYSWGLLKIRIKEICLM